jgi:hypothetical protein
MFFYQASTCSFFPVEVHGENIPDDAIEITRELYVHLIDNQAGKRIVMGDDGLPMIAERLPPSPEVLATNERAWRGHALAATDGAVARHRDEIEAGASPTLSAKEYAALQAYRLDLRGWPDAKGFPDQAFRPVAPDWMNT